MGATIALYKSGMDHVDNPYWSLKQLKIKQIDCETQRTIGELDKDKVLSFIRILTLLLFK